MKSNFSQFRSAPGDGTRARWHQGLSRVLAGISKRCLFCLLALVLYFPLSSRTHAETYRLEPGRSEIVVRVYRGGALRLLGHNHLVSTRSVIGSIEVDEDNVANTRFKFTVPLSSLQVDDPELRQKAGKGFTRRVSSDARRATRSNMLGKTVLDVAHYPEVRVHSRSTRQEESNKFVVTIELQIHGVTRYVSVPVEIDKMSLNLVARGQFSIRQTDFGITPIRAALATIVVRDEIDIHFELVASAGKTR